jgi:hypothetical protein
MYCTFSLIHKAFEPAYVVCEGRFTKVERQRSDEEYLEAIFYATNSIDTSWVDTPYDGIEFTFGEKVKEQKGCRSTNVGDVVTLMDWEGKNGRSYVCEMVGWRKLQEVWLRRVH